MKLREVRRRVRIWALGCSCPVSRPGEKSCKACKIADDFGLPVRAAYTWAGSR